MTPLITSVLDLDSALGGNADLLLGGGLGLYLKQQHLRETEARTLLAMDRLLTPSPNLDPDLVRESSCPNWGWKGFSDEEATQCRADRGLASAG